MLCFFSIILLVVSPEKLGEYSGVLDMNRFLACYAPIIVVSLLSLGCPAVSAISLEGKNIWILQSQIPIHINAQGVADITANKYFLLFGAVIPYSAYWSFICSHKEMIGLL